MTLSLITICRNNRDSIQKTVESVLGQKTPDVEYIVVDGASTDGTVELLGRYSKAIDVLVSEPDKGIYDAINKGIGLASGQVIGLVHGGDSLLPGVVPVILDAVRSHPGEILYGGIQTSRGGCFSGAYGYEYHRLREEMIPHPGTFVPRSIYNKFGLYDTSYKIAADYKAFLTFYLQGVPFHWLGILVADFDLSGVSSRSSTIQDEITRVQRECGIYVEPSRWKVAKRKIRRVLDSLAGLFE
jgi:glycosyltransferase